MPNTQEHDPLTCELCHAEGVSAELAHLRAEVERKETEIAGLRQSLAQASEDALRPRENDARLREMQSNTNTTHNEQFEAIVRAWAAEGMTPQEVKVKVDAIYDKVRDEAAARAFGVWR